MQPCQQATNNAISRRKEQRVLPSNEKPLDVLMNFCGKILFICLDIKTILKLINIHFALGDQS